mgnify:CR=1 FL=1
MTYARPAESGNMLIYILGAIFLMGLLIVIVKGSFQPGTGIDAEKAQIMANQIRAYGAELGGLWKALLAYQPSPPAH